ncbi:MAG: hypothetical protein AABW71_04610 [Nanoarchaeota archaeon]
MDIRTFGEQKSTNLGFSLNHQDRVRDLLESLGFKSKGGPVFLDAPINIYYSRDRKALIEVIARAIRDPPIVGFYYKVIGPTGVADNAIESIRSLSKRDGYEEIGALADSFKLR